MKFSRLGSWMAIVLCAASFTVGAATPVQSAKNDKRISHQALQRFGQSLEAVRQLYVDDVSDEEILAHAVRGMLQGLDPHSTYLDEKDLKGLMTHTKGEFSGVGMEVTMKDGIIVVVSPIDDSPAYKAGVKPGDMIVRINGKAVRGMSLSQAVMIMRGKAGTKVTITVVRAGEKKPLNLTLTRAKIELKSVRSKLIEQHYGYIRISNFGDKTNQAARAALKQLQQDSNNQLYGIVLDLRNNPGGLLKASVEISDIFLDANTVGHDKKVVFTKGRVKDMRMEGKVDKPDLTGGVPVVVLINGGSASASEIVAGALQDHKRAVVMGVRSFGKGSVQTVLPLKDKKTALKLTTARYYTPSGRSIQAKGIEPDVVVEALNIPKDAKPEQNFLVRESALNGRLAAEKTVGKGQSDPALQQDSKLLQDLLEKNEDTAAKKPNLYEDYQLHRAVSLLKVMHTTKAFGGKKEG